MSGALAVEPVHGLGASRPEGAKAVALAWPVWVTQVQVEQIGRRLDGELDLFEETVLDLASVGVRTIGELASDMDLDRQLVGFIVQGLEQRGLLDERLSPTESGSDLVRKQQDQERRYHTGYLLTDAYSGRLLPRLNRRLEPLAADGSKVTLGRATIRPFHIRSRRTAPNLVEPDVQRQAREAITSTDPFRSQPDSVRGVRALGEPWPAMVLVWAYRRVGGEERQWFLDRDIRVTDPAGDGDAISLEQELEELEADTPALSRALAVLRDESGDHERDRTLDQLSQKLLQRVGSVAPDHPAVTLLVSAAASRSMGNMRHTVTDLAAALETVFHFVLTEDELGRASQRTKLRSCIQAVLEQAQTACGFAPDAPRGTVDAVAHVGKAVPSLRVLAAYVVLTAADNPNHPLRRLASAEAEDAAAESGVPTPVAWLADIDGLAYHRNPSAHGVRPVRNAAPDVTPEQVDRWFGLVERSVSYLLSGAV